MTNKNINLIGSMSQTGYGVVAFNTLKYLEKAGWEVSTFPKGGTNRLPKEKEIIDASVNKSKLFDHDAPCLTIWHQFDLAYSVGRGKYVAYPFFELDKFTTQEVHSLNYPDSLIMSSEWASDICRDNGVTNHIDIVPPGVDLNTFNASKVPPKKNNTFVFLNCGKWEIRKGHDFIIDSFHQAFDKDDDVELWMMPTNPFLTEQETKTWESLYLYTPLGKAGKIKILPWAHSHEQVADVMAQADCGLFPSRAEGWNLELLEMMAMGKPVIATDYSAHTEFVNQDNCMMVDILDVESAYDGKWFFNQGNWAHIGQHQLGQIKEHMKFIYNEFHKGKDIYNEAGVETAKNLSWEKYSEKISEIMLT